MLPAGDAGLSPDRQCNHGSRLSAGLQPAAAGTLSAQCQQLGLPAPQGNLPTSLATLRKLTSLHFGGNQLSGILPRAFLVRT